ncbi:MAG: 30S ribosomal protein S2 [bacterium]|nr:30S ribosomal protein S2 [bacterium]
MAVAAKPIEPIEPKADPVTQEMMAAGLHFGHKTSKTHPKMKPFITGVRNTVHIIDLEKTKEKLAEAVEYVRKLKAEGKTLLLIGTKVQQGPLVKETAEACGLPYVTGRWIGGTFTNFNTIAKRVERLKELEQQRDSGEWDEKYTKKEQQDLKEEIRVLEATFGGIKDMSRVPDAVFICDLRENRLAAMEAKKKDVPIIAMADTDTNPEEADYFIPANNDAVSSIRYILEKIQEAWKA